MTTFHLMHCQPDAHQFAMWAARRGWLAPGGDLGYAFHAALHAVFGEHAPRPFFYRDERAGLLAYTSLSESQLREASALCSMPDLASALGLDAGPRCAGLNVRAFPTRFASGRTLGFEVRVRPMLRGKHEQRKHGCERDAYREPEGAEHDEDRPTRESVYAQWLARQFEATGAAKLLDARMTRFQLTDVIRRTQFDANGGKTRESRLIRGPDAIFSGLLEVGDSEAFARLLARGIGRHRAFGFGMLLLKPASMDR
jgi:CRISPR system Cascade subunit CasE